MSQYAKLEETKTSEMTDKRNIIIKDLDEYMQTGHALSMKITKDTPLEELKYMHKLIQTKIEKEKQKREFTDSINKMDLMVEYSKQSNNPLISLLIPFTYLFTSQLWDSDPADCNGCTNQINKGDMYRTLNCGHVYHTKCITTKKCCWACGASICYDIDSLY